MDSLYNIKEKFIQELMINQNNVSSPEQKDLFSKEDYDKILSPVCDIIKNNPDISMDELRQKVYDLSGLEESIRDFIYDRKLSDSMSISYGTKNYVETLSVGNIGGDVKAANNTIYDIASVSKLFTTFSVLKLYSMGEIDINKDITYYLPEFENLKGVTILQILTFNVPLLTNGRIDASLEYLDAKERLRTVKINEDYDPNNNPYTDIGAMILRELIVKVTGKREFDFVRENVLNKISMDDTHVIVPDSKIIRTAKTDGNIMYKDSEFQFRHVNPGEVNDEKSRILGQSIGDMGGHAGIFSTSSDMAHLAISMMKYDILSHDLLLNMSNNETGRYISELNKYRQYFGKLCYSKNPDLSSSEVYHPLSGRSIGSGGWTGTQFTVDPLNSVFFFMGANRTNDRIVSLPNSAKDDLRNKGILGYDENGAEYALIDGKKYYNSTRFAWDRDSSIVHPALRLSLCYLFLEKVYGIDKENNEINARTI